MISHHVSQQAVANQDSKEAVSKPRVFRRGRSTAALFKTMLIRRTSSPFRVSPTFVFSASNNAEVGFGKRDSASYMHDPSSDFLSQVRARVSSVQDSDLCTPFGELDCDPAPMPSVAP